MDDKTKKKRVCWLLNHTTLMEAEVPLLLEMGYEVFVPKQVNATMECRTASIDYQYDSSLSIPAADLDVLNRFNFYQEHWNEHVINLLNKHFEMAIVPFIIPTLYNMIRSFRGKMLLRVFGVAGDLDYESLAKYGDELVSKAEGSLPIYKRFFATARRSLSKFRLRRNFRCFSLLGSEIYAKRTRIWLAPSYQEIIEHEGPLFRDRAVYLPLGLGDSLASLEDTWVGGLNKILFVCPNVNQSEYYRQIYRSFIGKFGHLPYSIGGRQDLGEAQLENPISDPSIVGFQERKDYNLMLTRYQVMYYHSREPRHLHYHPIEAMLFGMPVLHLKGGLLCSLAGEDLPGMCRTEDEAVELASKILSGDRSIVAQIRSSQTKVLERFRKNYIRSQWEKSFKPLMEFR